MPTTVKKCARGQCSARCTVNANMIRTKFMFPFVEHNVDLFGADSLACNWPHVFGDLCACLRVHWREKCRNHNLFHATTEQRSPFPPVNRSKQMANQFAYGPLFSTHVHRTFRIYAIRTRCTFHSDASIYELTVDSHSIRRLYKTDSNFLINQADSVELLLDDFYCSFCWAIFTSWFRVPMFIVRFLLANTFSASLSQIKLKMGLNGVFVFS